MVSDKTLEELREVAQTTVFMEARDLWPSPIHFMELRKAAKTKASTVILSDIEYTLKWENDKRFWLSQSSGKFGCCGWFSIDRIERYVEAMLATEE